MSALPSIEVLFPADTRREPQLKPSPLARHIPAGKLVELSGRASSARTTTAVSLVVHAQREGQLVAWVQPQRGALYPPDLGEAGVDLESLVVVQVPMAQLPKAAELLLRSGTFGLVVLDITAGVPGKEDIWQSRLGGILRHHASKLVVLTENEGDAPSLGPWVGLRIEPHLERRGFGRFVLMHRVLKDKSGLGPMPSADAYRAPPGLA
jgi:recombination protein RecA